MSSLTIGNPHARERKWQNPYEGRWRWWYSAIADWMIRNPGGSMIDCAAELGRGINTVRAIASTDMFKSYLEQRKAEWRARHDFAIMQKAGAVAEKGLDLILETMQKKGDQVPLKLLNETTSNALLALGYGKPAGGPSVQVNNYQSGPTMQVAVSPAALEEARQAIRDAERTRAIEDRRLIPSPDLTHALPSEPTLELLPVPEGLSGGGEPEVEPSDEGGS